MYKLNSSTNSGADKTGLGITLKVMVGDKIDVFGKSYYTQNTNGTGGNSSLPVLNLLSGFLNAPGSAAVTGSHGIVNANDINNSAALAGINGMVAEQDNQSYANQNRPRAFINVIFFDEQFKTYTGGFKVSMVGANGVVKQDDHHADLQNLIAGKSGFVYIYCSNESPVDVFFDNVQVVHTRGAILEETHYYPFGLTMVGISSKAAGSPTNKNKYNGKELQNNEFSDGTGLEEYDFGARMQNPQLGIWHNTDPLADLTPSVSPYAFVADNPVNWVDPDGRTITGDDGKVKDLETAATDIIKGEERLQKRLEKKIQKRESKGKNVDGLNSRLSDSKDRVTEVTEMMKEISDLRASPQEYHVKGYNIAKEGNTKYNATTGAIDIEIGAEYGLQGVAHELAHAFEYQSGEMDFVKKSGTPGFLYDIHDEIKAYRRQFAINPNSLGSEITSLSQIDDPFVRKLSPKYYGTLPPFNLNKNSSLHTINIATQIGSGTTPVKNPGINFYNASKSYFPNLISN